MTTIALELVPPTIKEGLSLAKEEAAKIKSLLEKTGLSGYLNSLLVPQIVQEEDDRPVSLEKKMDPLECRNVIYAELPLTYILTQVTVYSHWDQLKERVLKLRSNGIEHVVFVGVPRILDGHDIIGLQPGEAWAPLKDTMPHRGVILIPTRPNEKDRFQHKLEKGANFALTQMLFSNQIVTLLDQMKDQPHRPEILLSFAYVPKLEEKVGLLQWLIKDTNPIVHQEMETIARIAGMPFEEKKQALVEIYKRVVHGVQEAGFPAGLHFECPYGVSEPALETFREMLEVWPGK